MSGSTRRPRSRSPYDSPNQVANAGIHSHGDGLIHTHPFVVSKRATTPTLGKFFSYGGWGLSSDSIDLGGANAAHTPVAGPDVRTRRTSWSNGDVCPFGKYKGQKAQLMWSVDGKKQTGNPADYHQQDGADVAIYLLPKGAEMPFPTEACTAFNQITDQTRLQSSARSRRAGRSTPRRPRRAGSDHHDRAGGHDYVAPREAVP